MTLYKHLIIAFVAAPLFATAAVTPAQVKSEKPCEQGCPFWNMEDMESFFNRPFSRISGTYTASTMKESDKDYLISIDLPGMDKKDISIETYGNGLMISGERKEDSENKEGSKHSFRQFNQSFSLPDDANLEAITATSTNGVLKITVPKTGGKKVSKKIEIK
ncbi:MAG: Hsp20/alpha crystallin family protein [Sulfuricurvum sp.]|nr:Hsp20/alpha crystallin family protein [Sulfuricurvum sp.]